MHITWDSLAVIEEYQGAVALEISIDGGSMWNNVIARAISPIDDSWKDFAWTIPDSVGLSDAMVSTVTTTARIRVRPYASFYGDISDANFTIIPAISNVAAQAPAGFRLALAGEALQLTFPQAAERTVSLYGLQGVLLEQVKTPGASVSLSLRPQAGLYVLKVAENGRRLFTQKVLMD